jgi:hypothetical protein
LVIGFHGCDASVRDLLLKDPNTIMISKAPYDWLGHGLYFWENNFERALQWAEDKKRRGKINNPAVIGAVSYYHLMGVLCRATGKEIPINKDLTYDKHKDKLLRNLDCSTIEFMYEEILSQTKADIKDKERRTGTNP